jgi:hypothetical protein
MKINYVLSGLVLVMGMTNASCKKDILKNTLGAFSPNSQFNEDDGGDTACHAYLYIDARSNNGSDTMFTYSGMFNTDTIEQTCDIRVAIGGLNIAGSNLPLLASSTCPYYKLSYDSMLRDYSNYFGRNITVGLTGSVGSGYSTVSGQFYAPKILRLTTDLDPQSTNQFGNFPVIEKNTGYTITWNEDDNEAIEGVAIILSYVGAFSHLENSSLDSLSFSETITTADDGSYFISAGDLSSFPVDSYISVKVLRGTSERLISNNRFVAVNITSSDIQGFILK